MLQKLRSAVRAPHFPAWSFPIALLALTLFTYGLRALSLGFYWDDWPFVWFFHRFGPAGLVNAFEQDRPFLSLIYTTTFSLLGESAPTWQIFALLARWLCSLGFWWALAQAWPRQPRKTALAAILFTVYPGFTQQWIAVIYGQAFLLYAAVFASTGLSLWLARRRENLPRLAILIGTIAALAFSAFTMFSTEYFFGLELLRPVLLFIILSATGAPVILRQRLTQTLRWWLPYLALMIVFVIWRAFFQVFPGHELSTIAGMRQNLLTELSQLGLTIVGDFIETLLAAWGQVLQLNGLLEFNQVTGLRLLAVILAGVLATFAFLARFASSKTNAPDQHMDHWARAAILVGLFAFLAGGWPFWITKLPMRMGFPLDRYSLPLAPGAALLLAGLIDGISRRAWHAAALAAVMVGLASGFHNTTALQYRDDWAEMHSFFWQLAWRAPSIEPGTVLLIDGSPFRFYEDDSLLGPLNWVYDPDGTTQEMRVTLFDLQVRYQAISELPQGSPVEKDYRGMQFRGSTDQALVLAYRPGSCLRILDPLYDSQDYSLTERLRRAMPLSQPQKLVRETARPAQPPEDMFGTEPKHRWCYYYARAELARQQQDWAAIYQLGEESIDKGFRPTDPVEYLPFIEGYIRDGRAADAYQLTMDAYQGKIALHPALCSIWQRAEQSGVAIPETIKKQLGLDLNCDSFRPGTR